MYALTYCSIVMRLFLPVAFEARRSLDLELVGPLKCVNFGQSQLYCTLLRSCSCAIYDVLMLTQGSACLLLLLRARTLISD